jgi:hypothetical protein
MSKKLNSFEVPQYWKAFYKETHANGEVSVFNTVLRAKSKDFARKILFKKTKEDSSDSRISFACFYRFHADYKIKGKKLSVTDWAHIRNAAFPNELNILFKK